MKAISRFLEHLQYLGYETHDYLELLKSEIETGLDELEQEIEIELLDQEGLEEEQLVYLAEQDDATPSEIMILIFQKTQKIVFRVNMDAEKSRLSKENMLEVFNTLNDAVRGAPKIFYDPDRDEIGIETVWFGDFYRQRLFERFFAELKEFCELALIKIFIEPEENFKEQAERLERLFQIEYEPGDENSEENDQDPS
ncbi:hypothetical protein COW36_09775 [bacterium (Candidatus Blackallbacteria) CG17_big_fil_post_rev_8_21_14_2_50_48_46]|uniref:Uncharacterized protein n=1 Tax=bacterium (Candidatus Blackallbacteria) CG17_big_fil_post_rev_8_21_14_2_50_48_46 TaxID=2014261 RepID=A0A2M7G5J7_9BACT|nr:MAG: hypothetical protein COW64_01635 [bacterium (Candidatus Blackallbacteria) CG18_big_fil_WC_8_21_14_2_50_49_26]PIW17248.1 MAG: hypothetical protein COW36_09775 [bacterium (Candidatus Blackallbacteria) CG17_big_fil_post_rev_8_21_14_2_50_48_46]PIW51040.1 MAG: hypothetical protein COW20_00785 [bacterium (Candidatus Blackallbacteria) CG13_big_fil_rev_8_21_14_2_50_49_14]